MIIVEAQHYHSVTLRSYESLSPLHRQLDSLWVALEGEPMQKYEFLRSRLALMYLWQDSSVGECFVRCLMNPPTHLVIKSHCARQRRISQLKDGHVFPVVPDKRMSHE
jgi:hypothetical protein